MTSPGLEPEVRHTNNAMDQSSQDSIALILKGLNDTLVQLTKASEMQTAMLVSLKDILLCSESDEEEEVEDLNTSSTQVNILLAGLTMPIGRRVEARQTTATGPPGWGLGSGLITHSQKTCLIQKQKLVYPLCPTVEKRRCRMSMPRLEQRVKQRMTLKPPMKLLLPKARVKVG